MKKIAELILSVIMLLTLSACGKSDANIQVDGKELVKAAQQEYKSLDSARLVVTDADTDTVVQEFTFRYEDDILHYLYSAVQGENNYYEYNDGKSVQIENKDEVKTYKWPSSNFKKYKRSKTHPNADTGIFFFEPKYIKALDGDVKDSTVTILENGTSYIYDYDMELLSKKMTTETSEGKMFAFETTYTFDKDGNFLSLVETSRFEKDEEKISHTYRVEITDRNNIEEIANPIE